MNEEAVSGERIMLPCRCAAAGVAEAVRTLRDDYGRLLSSYGPQGWWPSDGPFETMIGAVLTQNTAWTNAELAIANLAREEVLHDWTRLSRLDPRWLAAMIRPAGFQRAKAATLIRMAELVASTPGELGGLLGLPTGDLRRRLLALKGVGPETADAVVLYAAGRPVYVADAYSRRFAERRGLTPPGSSYNDVKNLFESAFEADADSLGECHALVVRLSKEHCRKRPLCESCPLNDGGMAPDHL